MSDELIPPVPPDPEYTPQAGPVAEGSTEPAVEPAPAPIQGVRVQAALSQLASQPPSTWEVVFSIAKAVPALIAQWKESQPVLAEQFAKFWAIIGPIVSGLTTARNLISDAFRDPPKA